MEATYTLVQCGAEWILLSSLKDYQRLHSLATIRATRSKRNSWDIVSSHGTDLTFTYTADSPLTAAKRFLDSMGLEGNIEVFN